MGLSERFHSRCVSFAVGGARLRKVAARRTALGRAGAVLHAGIVLVAVAAAGVGLAFAAVALARGAEALNGVGEREGEEEGKRGHGREEDTAERDANGAGVLRNEKGHALRMLAEKWPG